MNRLAIGKRADGVKVYENDTTNKTAIEDIDNEKKRARYSIVALAINGPTIGPEGLGTSLNSPYSCLNGHELVLPFYQGYGAEAGTVIESKSPIMTAWYAAEHPFVFLGGQVFISKVEVPGDVASYTTIEVKKYSADVATDYTTVVSRAIPNISENSLSADGTISTHDNKIIHITGGKVHFAVGESLYFKITPDSNTGSAVTRGLEGVSAILWLKVLHKVKTTNP